MNRRPTGVPDTVRGGTLARVWVRHVVEAGCLVCGAQEPARARQVLKLLADGEARSGGWLAEQLGLRVHGSLHRTLDWLIEHGHIEKVRDATGYRVFYRAAR